MFLETPPDTKEILALFDRAEREDGYVMNLLRLWSWRIDLEGAFRDMRKSLGVQTSISSRERALLVCAVASSLGDSYCALVWGATLAEHSDPDTAAAVLRSIDAKALTSREKALEHWARKVVGAPRPDWQVADEAPAAVREAVTYGRPVAERIEARP